MDSLRKKKKKKKFHYEQNNYDSSNWLEEQAVGVFVIAADTIPMEHNHDWLVGKSR